MKVLFIGILIVSLAFCEKRFRFVRNAAPNQQCYVPGTIQPHPLDTCTKDVLYCGWNGDMSQTTIFKWIHYQAACKSNSIVGSVDGKLTCILGSCLYPQLYEPCETPGEKKAIDVFMSPEGCTSYYVECNGNWFPHRCGPAYIWSDADNDCMYGPCPNQPIPDDPVEGEDCELDSDYQVYPDIECGDRLIKCFDGIWNAEEPESRCAHGQILNEVYSCVEGTCNVYYFK